MSTKYRNRGQREKVFKELSKQSEENYCKFQSRLCKSDYPMIGVRLPRLRKMAVTLFRESALSYVDEMKDAENETFEEVMLQGMILGFITDTDCLIAYLEDYLKKVDNWSVCDSTVASLKICKKSQKRMYEYALYLLKSDTSRPYKIRFGLVMLLTYFIDETKLDEIFGEIEKVNNHDYYVKMAIAWLVCECYCKYQDKTKAYLKESRLDDFTYKKALNKILESKIPDEKEKEWIKVLRKNRMEENHA